jgi:hypothetical protein
VHVARASHALRRESESSVRRPALPPMRDARLRRPRARPTLRLRSSCSLQRQFLRPDGGKISRIEAVAKISRTADPVLRSH